MQGHINKYKPLHLQMAVLVKKKVMYFIIGSDDDTSVDVHIPVAFYVYLLFTY